MIAIGPTSLSPSTFHQAAARPTRLPFAKSKGLSLFHRITVWAHAQLLRLGLRLLRPHGPIPAPTRQQILVLPALYDAALVQHEDLVNVHDRGEPVAVVNFGLLADGWRATEAAAAKNQRQFELDLRYDEGGAPFGHFFQRILNLLLRVRV